MKSIKIGILGIGRIGKLHLENIVNMEGTEIVAAMNPTEEGRSYAERFHIPIITSDADIIIRNPEIDAVLISSPTHTHAEYVIRAARAGKAIFCEKPLDLSLDRVKETLVIVEESNVPLMLGFNQRFDVNFSNIKKLVENGKTGKIHTLHIISRDPVPPPIDYIKNSGGLYMDMTIHDFDMARHIMGCEVSEVFAKGHNLIDLEIGKAQDIDTGIVILTFENNATAIIENSRKAVYGYDQRLEVFGSDGMIRAENPLKDSIQYYNQVGAHLARHPDFFMDRYALSYRLEIEAFLEAIQMKNPIPVSGMDGLKAMIIADAANRSMKERKPIRIEK